MIPHKFSMIFTVSTKNPSSFMGSWYYFGIFRTLIYSCGFPSQLGVDVQLEDEE
jgi:hypothetical protein